MRISEIMASVIIRCLVGLWIGRVLTLESAGRLRTNNDTSRTKLFILTEDQLSPFPTTRILLCSKVINKQTL